MLSEDQVERKIRSLQTPKPVALEAVDYSRYSTSGDAISVAATYPIDGVEEASYVSSAVSKELMLTYGEAIELLSFTSVEREREYFIQVLLVLRKTVSAEEIGKALSGASM